MKNIPEIYGSMVFNDDVMRAKLPKEIYRALQKTIKFGTHFELDVANAVANAMKEWAIEKGATHYTHWFQPMTGITAEKHDSFITPDKDGHILMEFSGKELVRGEPDASSFPSGGLRATFEARGYTAWDPSSYAFIVNSTLYIPTAFCSYSGEALDKKTPLLRSMDTLSTQALRICKLFPGDIKRVVPTVGAEQEYFLIDTKVYEKRPDLVYCNRTLLGAKPPKGQELEDHYFGSIKPRVAAFMRELDEELWKLGIPAKTEHNETAPAQHELAPVFSITNLAADQNQITMALMKSIAAKHNMVCLLHEKPFEGVNGSGKHNNWSLSTDDGQNLLEPGDTPSHNARFLLFLTAVIKAVDEHQDLLRISVAGAGNDRRLGANEAPPAILSIFLGNELTEILDAFENGTKHNDKKASQMYIGASVLPHFFRDTTDRNRTSPFAFTGNKFEFRMLGSSFSIARPNITINTIVANTLKEFADKLENSPSFHEDLQELIRSTIKNHKRIIFNGNNYSADWEQEAKKRGLLNLKTSVDALPYFINDKNLELFSSHNVYSKSEMMSRYEILLENYIKVLRIEAMTMIDMAQKRIIPAAIEYQKVLADTANAKKNVGSAISTKLEVDMLNKITMLTEAIYENVLSLETAVLKAKTINDTLKAAQFYKDTVLEKMNAIRSLCDGLETVMPEERWPYPSYAEMLYSVK